MLNQCSTIPRNNRANDTATGLASIGFMAEPLLLLRNDYQDAFAAGMGVTEYAADGKAADEIRQLWKWVSTQSEKGMSRRPTPSIFDADSMSVDDQGAKVITPEPPAVAEPRRVGRPAKTATKAKPTPFYPHPAVKEVLRDIAYHTRRKEHDLFVEGLEHVLRKHSYPTIAEIVAKAERGENS